jgi:uncharacterized protein YcgI (DUF1989 family)
MAEVAEQITIPARKGIATRVNKGQIVRVINTHGEQVVDTWAFNRRRYARIHVHGA